MSDDELARVMWAAIMKLALRDHPPEVCTTWAALSASLREEMQVSAQAARAHYGDVFAACRRLCDRYKPGEDFAELGQRVNDIIAALEAVGERDTT